MLWTPHSLKQLQPAALPFQPLHHIRPDRSILCAVWNGQKTVSGRGCGSARVLLTVSRQQRMKVSCQPGQCQPHLMQSIKSSNDANWQADSVRRAESYCKVLGTCSMRPVCHVTSEGVNFLSSMLGIHSNSRAVNNQGAMLQCMASVSRKTVDEPVQLTL